MDKAEYTTALRKLGLSPASKMTARAVGYCVRSCIRFANGEAKIPPTVAKLLRLALEVEDFTGRDLADL